jgi:hypothetical protein
MKRLYFLPFWAYPPLQNRSLITFTLRSFELKSRSYYTGHDITSSTFYMCVFCFVMHITLEVFTPVKMYIVAFLFDRWVRTTRRNILFPFSPSHARNVAGYEEDRGEWAVEGKDWPIRFTNGKNEHGGPLISVRCERAVKFIQNCKTKFFFS